MEPEFDPTKAPAPFIFSDAMKQELHREIKEKLTQKFQNCREKAFTSEDSTEERPLPPLPPRAVIVGDIPFPPIPKRSDLTSIDDYKPPLPPRDEIIDERPLPPLPEEADSISEIREKKIEVLHDKVGKITPHLPYSVTYLDQACEDDVTFLSLSKFYDTCHRVKEKSSQWKPEEIDLGHRLFQEISERHLELCKELQKQKLYPHKQIDEILKCALQRVHMPSLINLLVFTTKQFINPFMEMDAATEKELRISLDQPVVNDLYQKFFRFSQLMQKLFQEGEDVEALKKEREAIEPLLLYHFQDVDCLLKLLNIVKKASESPPDTSKAYSFLWFY